MGSNQQRCAVDSGMAESTGPGWIPESRVSTPESTSQGAVIALLFQIAWWLPAGVASQKSGPVASDVPRFARQHTNVARKEPETAVGWTPAGPSLDTGVQKGPVNAKGRASFPAHSPHLAFGIARSCCRCRRKKCCNTLESLRIQARSDLGQR